MESVPLKIFQKPKQELGSLLEICEGDILRRLTTVYLHIPSVSFSVDTSMINVYFLKGETNEVFPFNVKATGEKITPAGLCVEFAGILLERTQEGRIQVQTEGNAFVYLSCKFRVQSHAKRAKKTGLPLNQESNPEESLSALEDTESAVPLMMGPPLTHSGFEFDQAYNSVLSDHPVASFSSQEDMYSSTQDQNSALLPATEDSSPGSRSSLFNPTTIDGDLVVAGVASAYHFQQISDMRLKNNIKDVVGAMALIGKLRAVSFDWLTGSVALSSVSDTVNGPKRVLGFIAQEIREVMPEVVRVDRRTGFLSVSYVEIVPVLVSAFNEFYVEFCETQKANSAISRELKDLRDRFDTLSVSLSREGSFDLADMTVLADISKTCVMKMRGSNYKQKITYPEKLVLIFVLLLLVCVGVFITAFTPFSAGNNHSPTTTGYTTDTGPTTGSFFPPLVTGGIIFSYIYNGSINYQIWSSWSGHRSYSFPLGNYSSLGDLSIQASAVDTDGKPLYYCLFDSYVAIFDFYLATEPRIVQINPLLENVSYFREGATAADWEILTSSYIAKGPLIGTTLQYQSFLDQTLRPSHAMRSEFFDVGNSTYVAVSDGTLDFQIFKAGDPLVNGSNNVALRCSNQLNPFIVPKFFDGSDPKFIELIVLTFTPEATLLAWLVVPYPFKRDMSCILVPKENLTTCIPHPTQCSNYNLWLFNNQEYGLVSCLDREDNMILQFINLATTHQTCTRLNVNMWTSRLKDTSLQFFENNV